MEIMTKSGGTECYFAKNNNTMLWHKTHWSTLSYLFVSPNINTVPCIFYLSNNCVALIALVFDRFLSLIICITVLKWSWMQQNIQRWSPCFPFCRQKAVSLLIIGAEAAAKVDAFDKGWWAKQRRLTLATYLLLIMVMVFMYIEMSAKDKTCW